MTQKTIQDLLEEADELIGDSDTEVIKEILLAIKKQSSDASSKDQKVLDALESLTDRIESGDVSLREALDDLMAVAKSLKIQLPENFKVWVENQVEYPKEVEVSNLKDIKLPKFPDEIETKEPKWLGKYFKLVADAVKQKTSIQKVKLEDVYKPSKPIAVRLSDGKKFYNALMAVASGGGYKQVIIEDTTPIHDSKMNERFNLAFDASDNLTTIDMTIEGITYRRTITWTADNPTAISSWSTT